MAKVSPRVFSPRSFWLEFRWHLPIWFLYLESVGLLHASLANFPETGFQSIGIPRSHFAPTILFPMVWFVAYFVLRIRHSKRWPNPYLASIWLFFMAVVVPVLIVTFYRTRLLTTEQLAVLFEVAQFTWVALFVAQIVSKRGWNQLVLFFGVTFVYGLLLENAGIFMGFFFEPSFSLYIPFLPAPLCTMLGWCLVFYVTVAITEEFAKWLPKLANSVWRRSLMATGLALSMDAQLDPLASMSGVFWRWNDLLPPWFLGVPFINFAAWFGAFLPYTYIVFKSTDRKDWPAPRRNWEIFIRVPLAALLGGLLCFGLMTFYERGFSGPTFQILSDFGHRLNPY